MAVASSQRHDMATIESQPLLVIGMPIVWVILSDGCDAQSQRSQQHKKQNNDRGGMSKGVEPVVKALNLHKRAAKRSGHVSGATTSC